MTDTPAHLRPGAARYTKTGRTWTLLVDQEVLDSITTTDATTVLATKRGGTTKEQRITGKYRPGEEPGRYHLELAAEERTHCAECNRSWPVDAMEEEPDSSGIVLPVCPRCARLAPYERSYA
ncbi:hypothetical protein [Streptomyces sp. ST2-7A]|uniref:hypothetical protein n=1 Tax=Streptomyces sp. ST2-7A TaxID=2907214 RepID=UPI001F37536B|nr:hypothetical protein [Streptomyces sp. ST2-7A]MCE7081137.1 hypothetical protein [Streptomyces sp. ST2-7A]